jgi:predicted unusual protein kinase regulating ubiquinone biosynthesis (AarF/ABC1/UbiB family)
MIEKICLIHTSLIDTSHYRYSQERNMGAQKDLYTNRLTRFLEMSKLTTKIGANYLLTPLSFGKDIQEVIKEKNKKNAEMIAETLGRLKGPILKVGQLVSTYDEFLPEEIVEPFSKMQDSVPPLDYEVIRKEVKKELGKDPEHIFSNFSKEPIAGASFGQVHKARLKDGRYVAVKVQYPKIDKVLESDMKMLKLWLSLSDNAATKKFMGDGIDLDAVYNEIYEHIQLELDYENEARNIRKFQTIFAGDAEVEIPQVYDELSTKRVLTMDFMDGHKLKDALSPNLPRAVREKIGNKLVEMFFAQVIGHGVIHGDPHPGNYLLGTNDTIQLLDFGCVKFFSPAVHQNLVQFYSAAYHNDDEGLFQACVNLGLTVDRADYEKFWSSYDGWDIGHDINKNYKLADLSWSLFMTGMLVSRKAKFNTEMLYYLRTLVGIFSYFFILDIELNVHKLLEKYIVTTPA